MCISEQLCLDQSFVCDGVPDCISNSINFETIFDDEARCPREGT